MAQPTLDYSSGRTGILANRAVTAAARAVGWAGAFCGLAAAIAGGGLAVWYRTAGAAARMPDRSLCIGAAVLGMAATICLAAAMHFLDVPLAADTPPAWYVRWPLKAGKRALLVGQLALTAVAVYAVLVLLFGDVPGQTIFRIPRS